jgi:K+/H+ antiporter YhaU regulatory subunit KhtT
MCITARLLWSCREAQFRARFHASIVSIRRQGHKLQGKLGDVKLQPGDELLFDCGDDFSESSPIVKANLTLIGLVKDEHVREFMFAFKVQGTFPPTPEPFMCSPCSCPRTCTLLLLLLHAQFCSISSCCLSENFMIQRSTLIECWCPQSAPLCSVGSKLWVGISEDKESLAGVGSRGPEPQSTEPTTAPSAPVRTRGARALSMAWGGTVAGKTVAAAGLRGLPDAFLVAIERGNTTLHAVAPTEVLKDGDILWFTGSAEGMIALRKIPGATVLPSCILSRLLTCACSLLLPIQ